MEVANAMGSLSPSNSSSYTVQDQQLMREAQNYFAWQGCLVSPALGRRIVEVGCGVGNFTAMMLDRELVVALDKEPACVAQIKKRYSDSRNVQAFVSDVSSPEFSDLAHFRADSCVCLNVLEHIEDDRTALGRMASILVPGGVIVLLVPAFSSLYGPIDAHLGHFRRYTRESLHRSAASIGLSILRMHYVNFVGFFGWWANSRVFRRQAQSPAQIRMFDRWIVPIMSRLESLVPPPFGQSLFAILQKP